MTHDPLLLVCLAYGCRLLACPAERGDLTPLKLVWVVLCYAGATAFAVASLAECALALWSLLGAA